MSEASSPEHDWLTRHDASAWLAAARHELAGLPTSTVTPGARRKAVTILRRGAGMALNGALMHGWRAGRFDLATAATRWGRSYMDHLRALAGDADVGPLGPETRDLARRVLATPLQAQEGGLVTLRRPNADPVADAADAAQMLVTRCEALLSGDTPP